LEALWYTPLDARGSNISAYRLEWFSAPGRSEVQTIAVTGAGGGTWTVGWEADVSDALRYDVSAAGVKAALEAFVAIPEVEVERVETTNQAGEGVVLFRVTFTGDPADMGVAIVVDATGLTPAPGTTTPTVVVERGLNTEIGCGAVWDVTSGSEIITSTTSGDVSASGDLHVGDYVEARSNPLMRAEGTVRRVTALSYDTPTTTMSITLDGPFTGATATAVYLYTGLNVPGAEPLDVMEALIPATSVLSEPLSDAGAVSRDRARGYFRYLIAGLPRNTRYYARVASTNDRGYGVSQVSVPASLAPPRQKPDSPIRASLYTQSAAALKVTFYAPESDGGDAITKYEAQWDTRPTFDSRPGGGPLGHQDLLVQPGACGTAPCEITIGGLTQGVSYYVRIYSYNGFGFSARPALPFPLSEAPRTFAAPPAYVSVAADTDSTLRVSFPASANNGGSNVTRYRIEWDIMGADAVTLGQTPSPVLYSRFDVQELMLTAPAPGMTGNIRLSYEGFATGDVPVDISADELAATLSALPTLGAVLVDRRRLEGPDRWGFAWRVTFTGNPGNASSLLVSVDGGVNYLPLMMGSASGGRLVPDTSRAEVRELVTGLRGFEVQEVQVDFTAGAGLMPVATDKIGHLTLTFEGRSTPSLRADSSPEAMRTALEALGNTGDLLVYRKRTVSGAGFVWTIIFMSRLGNQAPLAVTGSLATGYTVTVTEVVTGSLPALDSALRGTSELDVEPSSPGPFTFIVPSLVRGASYHVRVSAYNGVQGACGPAQFCTPATVTVLPQPQAPKEVDVQAASSSSLRVTWQPPANVLVGEVRRYRVEWDTNGGAQEQQLIRVASRKQGADADAVGGTFRLAFGGAETGPLSPQSSAATIQTALEGLSTVGEVSVSTAKVLGGRSWLVTFLSNVGDLPLLTLMSEGLAAGADGVASDVTEVVAGTPPTFDKGTVGIAVKPLGSTDVTPLREVQSITAVSEYAADLDGTFLVSYMGGLSFPINVHDSASTVADKLKAIHALGSVTVTRTDLVMRTTPPLQQHGVRFDVTFTSPLNSGDVPSMLVSTNADGSLAGVTAGGGTLTGSIPRVTVREVVKGGIPTTYSVNALATGVRHFVRVYAVTSAGTGPAGLSPFAARPTAVAPEAPRQVTARPLSSTSALVQWYAPFNDGGSPVTTFYVQWSPDPSFGSGAASGSALVNASSPSSGAQTADGRAFSYIVVDMVAGTDYHLRVMAYNERGYGSAAPAVPVASHEEVQELAIVDSAGPSSATPLTAGEYRIAYGVGGLQTIVLPFDATAADIQAALQGVSGIGSVDVTKTDGRFGVDGTLADATYDAGVTFMVTFRGPWSDGERMDIKPLTAITTVAQAYEIQEIVVFASSGDLTAGSYALSDDPTGNSPSSTTACLSFDASDSDVANEIGSIFSAGPTVVRTALTTPGKGFKYTLTYAATDGDVAPLYAVSVGTGACTPFAGGEGAIVRTRTVREGNPSAAAMAAFVPATASASARTLRQISPEGLATTTLRLTNLPPAGPSDVVITIVSDAELGVTWKAPFSSGGASAAPTKYRIEWDPQYNFAQSDTSVATAAKPYTAYIDASCDPVYCVWNGVGGVYKYKIDATTALTAGTP